MSSLSALGSATRPKQQSFGDKSVFSASDIGDIDIDDISDVDIENCKIDANVDFVAQKSTFDKGGSQSHGSVKELSHMSTIRSSNGSDDGIEDKKINNVNDNTTDQKFGIYIEESNHEESGGGM